MTQISKTSGADTETRLKIYIHASDSVRLYLGTVVLSAKC